MPDGDEILIGHGIGVVCWFSFGCDFGLCPIVPDDFCLNQDGQDFRKRRMPDGGEILIGHAIGVVGWFSFGCDFGVCPIVPDVGCLNQDGRDLRKRGILDVFSKRAGWMVVGHKTSNGGADRRSRVVCDDMWK